MTRPARLALTELSRRITARFNECEANGGHRNSGRYIMRSFPDGNRDLYICARCEVPIVGSVIRWKINAVPPKERREPVTFDKECVVCGKAFTTRYWRLGVCSMVCERQRSSVLRRIRRANGRFPRVCPQCGKAFHTHRESIRFCSIRCGVLARHARKRAAA